MVDYAPPWDSMQAPHEMPLYQVRKSATALANLLDENKDEQVLKEACLGLCQLFGEGIQNDRIQAILEANVVPKLVALLRPSKSRSVPIPVQSAALQVLGNVACGDDRQTQVVIDSDALPCLRALLSSSDRGIRKEVCWIVSNITESSHQVQDVLDADILPPLLKLLDNQDTACREDATWVLFNLSSNRDPRQISYLADKNGVRALCNLLACTKDLDVLWKGCGTVAAVALKGLRNILVSGHAAASSSSNVYNQMAALVAEAHGVERIESLTNHEAPDVRNRARLILERLFGTEPSNMDYANAINSSPPPSSHSFSPSPPALLNHTGCSCPFQQQQSRSNIAQQYRNSGICELSNNISTRAINAQFGSIGFEHTTPAHLHSDNDRIDGAGSSSGSSTDSDPEDDDSDSDLIPPPPPPCSCVLCTDTSPLIERRLRVRAPVDDRNLSSQEGCNVEVKQLCNFCSGGDRLGDGRSGLAAKIGRAVRLGHLHCLALLLSRMTWGQRSAATEAPALLHPGSGPPDGGVGNSLPAVVLAAQLGKPDCLGLLLRKCRPDLDVTHGKKRLTALSWAAHKGYMRCCQLLIEHGSNPATKCGDGVTALHLAASGGGHVGICKLLIDNNAPINARSCKKQTPLCLAAQKGYSKVVQLLLNHGADVSNEDEGKYTPLHLAASKGFEDCVELLLNNRARVDAMTRKSVTPLHYAVQGGHASVVQSLITAGAQVDCTHKPLLLIAADDGNVEVVHILLDAQAAVDCKANIRAMLDKDTEVSDYLTPLHLAASKAHQEVVELLINRGADVNEVTTKRGWSALDFSVLNGHTNCAITLLEHGAFVTDNCKTIGRNSWTLVQYAAHHGAKDVVRLLIQRLKEQRKGLPSISGSGTESGLVKISDEMISTQKSSRDVDAGESLSRSYKSNSASISTSTPSNRQQANASAVQIDHSLVDESCAHAKTQDGFSLKDGNYISQPAHRYDPRSLDGDEVGFGTGPGYGNNLATSEITSSKSRRRLVKDDRQSTTRAREIKKRESEANEARDRLEEAMNQKSVSKLTEAISHVSKLVLHLAASAGNETNGNSSGDSIEPDTLEAPSSAGGQTHGIINDGLVSSGPILNDVNSSNSNANKANNSPSPSRSNVFSAPLAMEVGLGNEVQKARKVLAALLAEEKRIREEKEKEAADSKRENAQLIVRKAIKAAKEGGDPRSLTRAIARATRTVLDNEEDVILQGCAVAALVSDLEKTYSTIKTAMHERDLETLCKFLPKADDLLTEMKKKGGDGASQRAFGGGDPNKVLIEGERLKNELREKRKRAEQEAQRAKDLEKFAKDKLEAVMKSNDIVALELATKQASEALLSKHSELGSAIEAAKKVLAKWVKGERRKLKQARNSSDPDVIERTAAAASQLGLLSLQSDIDGARAHALKLREQSEALKILATAIGNSDSNTLNEIRNRLTGLGMFSDAERARAEAERLQRSKRARSLLEESINDAEKKRDGIAHALTLVSSTDDGDDSNTDKSTAFRKKDHINPIVSGGGIELDALSELSTLNWPDTQRLHELSERAKHHGQSSSSLCNRAEALLSNLANLGRQILRRCIHSNDAQAIAAVVAGYEKSFLAVPNPDVFDLAASESAISDAKERLAAVQSMDQERVKAESAQAKVEYAIATSRRTTAIRNRNSKSASTDDLDLSARNVTHSDSMSGSTDIHSLLDNSVECKRTSIPGLIDSTQNSTESHRINSNLQFHPTSCHSDQVSISDEISYSSPTNSASSNLLPITVISRAHSRTPGASHAQRSNIRTVKIERNGMSTSTSQSCSTSSANRTNEQKSFKGHDEFQISGSSNLENVAFLSATYGSGPVSALDPVEKVVSNVVRHNCNDRNKMQALRRGSDLSIENVGSSGIGAAVNGVPTNGNPDCNQPTSSNTNHCTSQVFTRNASSSVDVTATNSCGYPGSSSSSTIIDVINGSRYPILNQDTSEVKSLTQNRELNPCQVDSRRNVDFNSQCNERKSSGVMICDRDSASARSPSVSVRTATSDQSCTPAVGQLAFIPSESGSLSTSDMFSQSNVLRSYGFGLNSDPTTDRCTSNHLSTLTSLPSNDISRCSSSSMNGNFVHSTTSSVENMSSIAERPNPFPMRRSVRASSTIPSRFDSGISSLCTPQDSPHHQSTGIQSDVHSSLNGKSLIVTTNPGLNTFQISQLDSQTCNRNNNLEQHQRIGQNHPNPTATGLNLSGTVFNGIAAVGTSTIPTMALASTNPIPNSVANTSGVPISIDMLTPEPPPSHHHHPCLITLQHSHPCTPTNEAESSRLHLHQQTLHQLQSDIVHGDVSVGVVSPYSTAPAHFPISSMPKLDSDMPVPRISDVNSRTNAMSHHVSATTAEAARVSGNGIDCDINVASINDFRAPQNVDLGLDFENENFGFDINSIVDDIPPPLPLSKSEDNDVSGDMSLPVDLEGGSHTDSNAAVSTHAKPDAGTCGASAQGDSQENENCAPTSEPNVASTGNISDGHENLCCNEGGKRSRRRDVHVWSVGEDKEEN